MNLSGKIEASKIIIDFAINKYPRIFAACSLGKDSRVLIDLTMSLDRNFKFIGIDTGYEFSETLAFANRLIKETKMDFRWIKPSKKAREKIELEYQKEFIKNDQYKCCAMKIPVIESLLKTHDAWMTGLRRDETEFRRNIKPIEYGRKVKINPLAFWSNSDVWRYIKSNKLSYHPLYDAGYTSLGCQPCTTKGKVQFGGGRQGHFERAGRFVGTSHLGGECGLHTYCYDTKESHRGNS